MQFVILQLDDQCVARVPTSSELDCWLGFCLCEASGWSLLR